MIFQTGSERTGHIGSQHVAVLQLCEYVFDEMALFIQMPVVRWL